MCETLWYENCLKMYEDDILIQLLTFLTSIFLYFNLKRMFRCFYPQVNATQSGDRENLYKFGLNEQAFTWRNSRRYGLALSCGSHWIGVWLRKMVQRQGLVLSNGPNHVGIYLSDRFGVIWFIFTWPFLYSIMWWNHFTYSFIILKPAAGILKLSSKLTLQICGILQVHLQILHFFCKFKILL